MHSQSYEMLFFPLRKAVDKTAVVTNLAIYVAQDCTGEIYRVDICLV